MNREVDRGTEKDRQASKDKYVDREDGRTDLDWDDSRRTSVDRES